MRVVVAAALGSLVFAFTCAAVGASDGAHHEGRATADASSLASRSGPLRNAKLHDPMPGGVIAGYAGDTGLDIAGHYLDVFALGAGTVDYAEWGHTRWTSGKDTAFTVRIALDEPIPWGEHKITHVYCTHLSKLAFEQKEGAPTRRHVEAGERIGVSGIGNGSPHLHLGLLLDGQVEQDSWTYILRENDIRRVMGGYRNGERLRSNGAPNAVEASDAGSKEK